MKRLLTLFMLAALMLSLTACGEKVAQAFLNMIQGMISRNPTAIQRR